MEDALSPVRPGVHDEVQGRGRAASAAGGPALLGDAAAGSLEDPVHPGGGAARSRRLGPI